MSCPSRLAEGEQPYCVYNCPNGALSIGELAAQREVELREKGFRIFKLPAWEGSAEDVVYASKG